MVKVDRSNFALVEYSRSMKMTDNNTNLVKENYANTDWSINKKGFKQCIVSQKFNPEQNNEI